MDCQDKRVKPRIFDGTENMHAELRVSNRYKDKTLLTQTYKQLSNLNG